MALTHTPEPEIGSLAPDFALPGIDGGVVHLADVRGERGLLVMFICAHCPYVQAIEARLAEDTRELIGVGVGVVAICSNDAIRYPEDSPEKLRAQAARCGFPFPYLIDESQDVARAYGAVCTPDFFGYDRDLKLRFRGRLDAAQRGPREDGMRRELVEAMRDIAERGDTSREQVPSMGCSIKWRV
ncbi:MAG TPA: thioredoxin family protein [Xanthomonadaceae bacterium]|nr:thioredoxin family protein [Xanthomonadaceae bacterium]